MGTPTILLLALGISLLILAIKSVKYWSFLAVAEEARLLRMELITLAVVAQAVSD
jgi:hypothetical protein